MKSFLTFFEQAEDTSVELNKPQRLSDDCVTCFGRHNPPHIGHKLTFDRANQVAQDVGGDQRFYTSRSQDAKKNPLPYELKVDHLQRMFPDHKDKWDTDDNVRTVLDSAKKAHADGYKNFHYVGGGDRKDEMEKLLRKYNGDLYDFQNIHSHDAGSRDDLDDPISMISASKQRDFAQNDDFEGFNEDVDIRELYATGQIFLEGDVVESLVSGLQGRIHRRGANHLICVTEDGIMFKNFLTDVISV
jgi:nicotinic acid mononucleotide adenylyltransferase